MTLRMICDVHQKAAQRYRELFPADKPCFLHFAKSKALNSLRGIFERSCEFREELRFPGRFLFIPESPGLAVVQGTSFRVREQPIEAARDVPDMKSHGDQSERTGAQFFISQWPAPALYILSGELQCM
jgi:hypothetical protein